MLLDSLMVRTLLRPLVACVQVFALYIVLHGHYSPGGGFQGGVLLGCSWFLPLLVHGRESTRSFVTERAALAFSLAGAGIFVATGIVPLFGGRALLDYAGLPLASDEATLRFVGILIVELGVALAVGGVVMSLFHSLGSIEEEAPDAGAASGEREAEVR